LKDAKYYLIIFFSTQETLYAEKVLKKNRLKHELVPPPERVKTECGLAIKFGQGDNGGRIDYKRSLSSGKGTLD